MQNEDIIRSTACFYSNLIPINLNYDLTKYSLEVRGLLNDVISKVISNDALNLSIEEIVSTLRVHTSAIHT